MHLFFQYNSSLSIFSLYLHIIFLSLYVYTFRISFLYIFLSIYTYIIFLTLYLYFLYISASMNESLHLFIYSSNKSIISIYQKRTNIITNFLLVRLQKYYLEEYLYQISSVLVCNKIIKD